ncbi:MAG: hypothetical protein JXA99_16495 [Candidatus Lokiarchaeota archaeon]|nr:hypothetical protein [Candidatus Lokiarchaeota archaeon]
MIKKIKSEGITCGMYLLPVIPFITDTKNIMEQSIKSAKDAGVDFIIFGGLTLKEGKQKNYFLNVLNKYYPELLSEYEMIYKQNKYGTAIDDYYYSINQTFYSLAKEFQMSIRIPFDLIKNNIDENDKIVFILDCIDYYLKLKGERTSYGYAAYLISRINEPMSSFRKNLRKINGIGETTRKIICEIIDTGKSTYLEKLQIN